MSTQKNDPDHGLSEGFKAFRALKDLGQLRRSVDADKAMVLHNNLKGSSDLSVAIVQLQEMEKEIATTSCVALALKSMDPEKILEDVERYVDENSLLSRINGYIDDEGPRLMFTIDSISLVTQESSRVSVSGDLEKKLYQYRKTIREIGKTMRYNKFAFVSLVDDMQIYCKEWDVVSGPLYRIAHPKDQTLKAYDLLLALCRA